MSKSYTTALAATCLILSACGGGSTEPHCCATLEGTWVGTEGDLTLRIVVGVDSVCIQQYGYCEDSGKGTYSRSGGDSGSFVMTGMYYVNIGQSAIINMSDSLTYATTIFGGNFDSATKLSGNLYDLTGDSSLLKVGTTGVPITLNKQ